MHNTELHPAYRPENWDRRALAGHQAISNALNEARDERVAGIVSFVEQQKV